jgi:hypothetical protein
MAVAETAVAETAVAETEAVEQEAVEQEAVKVEVGLGVARVVVARAEAMAVAAVTGVVTVAGMQPTSGPT